MTLSNAWTNRWLVNWRKAIVWVVLEDWEGKKCFGLNLISCETVLIMSATNTFEGIEPAERPHTCCWCIFRSWLQNILFMQSTRDKSAPVPGRVTRVWLAESIWRQWACSVCCRTADLLQNENWEWSAFETKLFQRYNCPSPLYLCWNWKAPCLQLRGWWECAEESTAQIISWSSFHWQW